MKQFTIPIANAKITKIIFENKYNLPPRKYKEIKANYEKIFEINDKKLTKKRQQLFKKVGRLKKI